MADARFLCPTNALGCRQPYPPVVPPGGGRCSPRRRRQVMGQQHLTSRALTPRPAWRSSVLAEPVLARGETPAFRQRPRPFSCSAGARASSPAPRGHAQAGLGAGRSMECAGRAKRRRRFGLRRDEPCPLADAQKPKRCRAVRRTADHRTPKPSGAVLWSAPAERSGDGALASARSNACKTQMASEHRLAPIVSTPHGPSAIAGQITDGYDVSTLAHTCLGLGSLSRLSRGAT